MSGVRVGLVALHAQSDDYVGDDQLASLSARLSAAGHDVVMLRSTRGDRPLTVWQGELAAWSATHAPALVVFLRAWERSQVEAVRAAAPSGTKIIRVSSGGAAAIDDAFDAVVDAHGVLALLSGEVPAAPALPKNAKQIRALSLAVAPSAEAATAGASIGGRPTIAGPAVGCPFLLDVRKSHYFAGLDLEAAAVQTKGCSFCLDNVGAYAAPPADAVVGAWLEQLRAIRRVRPDVREVLLIDELPHGHLASFFRAIAEEPALHGIELLWKSRVDWFLEHEARVVEAIEEARKSKSVLHLYLIGFESFDDEQLALFNKGVTVEDNVRAIARLRALRAQHADAFELEKLRAHGIVMFTPWTTTRALANNARLMRELRFSELRSEALRTRLRLYARTPLHALAVRDGLIASSFADGRTDRATEQGYDASVPWRFRDAAVEAVFQITNRLLDVDRSLPEPDLLDCALDLLAAHPRLADEPQLAALPLLQALATRRALLASISASDLRSMTAELATAQVGSKAERALVSEGAASLARAYQLVGRSASAFGDVVVSGPCDWSPTPPVAPPPLPEGIRAGMRLAEGAVISVYSDADAHAILVRGTSDRVIRLRSHVADRPYTLRLGGWALDIEDASSLRDPDKANVSALLTLLGRAARATTR